MPLKNVIIGNERIANILESNCKAKKLSHAYLFEGPEHIGKKTLALNFCRLLLNDGRGDIEKNPDLTVLSPDETDSQITIEKIRELEKSLSLYPHSSKYKIIIIEQAEKMTKAASNALLKTLEEPSKTTILILITSNSKIILDTIKSRCQRFKFLPVKKKLLEKLFKEEINDKSEIERVIEMSGYRPGKIVEFINNKDRIKKAAADIKEFAEITKKGEAERIDRAEVFSKENIKEISNILDLWAIFLRNTLLEEYKKENCERENLSEIKRKIYLVNNIKEDILTKNVSVRLAMENLLLEI
jgi:DNA polymerase-3 subunit delta'